MPRFSANLGFLWQELSLPDAIFAAKAGGFSAVECHWPYEVPASEIRSVLTETNIPMVCLNTRRGDPELGEFGLSAIPGRETEAREHIYEAVKYADQIGCGAVHVMAGISAQDDAAYRTFRENILYACETSESKDITILIEPINHRSVPGYYLTTLQQALGICGDVNQPNLKIMFDCFHQQISGGDLLNRLKDYLPSIGHIQFASVPGRNEPCSGEINFDWLFDEIDHLGWQGYVGAEYIPLSTTDEGLDWLKKWRQHDV